MKKTFNIRLDKYRIRHPLAPPLKGENYMGIFMIPFNFNPAHKKIKIISSGPHESWEHVSVSHYNRCPYWKEMCFVKNLFWDEEETVIQYHPKKSEYINIHNYVLHLWKPVNIDIPLPPSIFV